MADVKIWDHGLPHVAARLDISVTCQPSEHGEQSLCMPSIPTSIQCLGFMLNDHEVGKPTRLARGDVWVEVIEVHGSMTNHTPDDRVIEPIVLLKKLILLAWVIFIIALKTFSSTI